MVSSKCLGGAFEKTPFSGLQEAEGLVARPPTQGMPFCLVGSDQLALFRCISCHHLFHTDTAKSSVLDAPARVFASSLVRSAEA